MKKDINYYLSLPYTIEVIQDKDEKNNPYWFARVVELTGCMTEADSFAELGEMIQDALVSWLEVALEDNITIPEPQPIENYSGKFVVRVPKSLHRQLAETANRDGVSLNTFINVALGRAIGQTSFPKSKVDNVAIPIRPQLSMAS